MAIDKKMDQEVRKNEKYFRNKKKELNAEYDKKEQDLTEKHLENLKKLEKDQKANLADFEKEAIKKREKDRKTFEKELNADRNNFKKIIHKKLQTIENFDEILLDLDSFIMFETTILDRIRIHSQKTPNNPTEAGTVPDRIVTKSKGEIKAERARVEGIIMKRRRELELRQIDNEIEHMNSSIRNVIDQTKERQLNEIKDLKRQYVHDLWCIKKDRLLIQEGLDKEEVQSYFSIKRNFQVLKVDEEAKALQENALKSLERLAKIHQVELKTLHKLTKSANAGNRKLNKAITKNYKNLSPVARSSIIPSELSVSRARSTTDFRPESSNIHKHKFDSTNTLQLDHRNSRVSGSLSFEKVINDFDNMVEENLKHLREKRPGQFHSQSHLNQFEDISPEVSIHDDLLSHQTPLGEVRNLQSRQWANELQSQYELTDKLRSLHHEVSRNLVDEEKRALSHVHDFYQARLRDLYDNSETASILIDRPDFRKSKLNFVELDETKEEKTGLREDPKRVGCFDETNQCNQDSIKRQLISEMTQYNLVEHPRYSPPTQERNPKPSSVFSSTLSLDHDAENKNYRVNSMHNFTPLLTDLSRL